MVDNRLKLLFIAGSGRNGSTLLARLLGQIDGYQNIGEATQYLFNERMIAKQIPCGCGRPLSKCEFWQEIISDIGIDEIRPLSTSLMSMRQIPMMLSPIKSPSFQKKIQKLLSVSIEYYEAIQKKSGCKVIVDASKNPTNAFILGQLPDIDLYVVHLVRDPRGTVSSWSKPKGYLRSFPMHTTTLWWLAYNLFSELLRFSIKKYVLVRYEDFVQDPSKHITKIAQAVTNQDITPNFIEGSQVWIDTQHMLGSNPDKLSSGQVMIKDQHWDLPWFKVWFVSLATFPLLLRYHYVFPRPVQNKARAERTG